MKIVYFNYLYDLYGISIGSTRKAERLISELSTLGHDVKMYWLKSQPQSADGTSKTQSTKTFFKEKLSKYLHDPKQFLSNIKYIYQELKIIKKENPDLIISRLENYLFSSLLIAKLKNIPLVIEADAPGVYELGEFHKEFWQITWLADFIEKLNLKLADKSVCVSNPARKYFIKKGVPEEKLITITNGADINYFNPSIRSNGLLSDYNLKGKKVIGFVGSFHFWHGVDNLLEVINRTIKSDKNTAFLMVGEGGPMKAALEKYVLENNLNNRVILTGYVPHEKMPEYISAMDIVLAPYPNLKFFYYSPVKIFEYMACGKPVVTTNLGQLAEIISDNENGFLCEPDNIEQIITTVGTLIKNNELREKIGNNAHKTIIENHTWHMKARQLSEVCQDVVSKYNHN